MRFAACFAALAALAAGGLAGATGSAPAKSRQPLLAIAVRDHKATLVRLDPLTLQRLGTRGIPVANVQVLYAFAPDGSKLVVGAESGLRFISVNPLRLLGRTPSGPQVKAIGWPTARRVVVFQHGALVTLDPSGPRARTSVIRLGSVQASAVYAGGLVMLGAPDPPESDGSLHLTVADPAGRIRDTKLDLRAQLDLRPPFALGLALDGRGQKAYVVGTAVVAEIDLTTLQTTYHALGVRTPAAQGLHSRRPHKAIPAHGASFTVRWVGSGTIAVARSDWKMARDEAGVPVTTRTPGGLSLIDTRTWSERLVEAEASNVSVVPTTGTVLAFGSSWNSKLGTTGGMGLTAFGADGSERFHRFGEAGVELLGVQSDLAYVSDGKGVHVVDAASGKTLRLVRRAAATELVTAAG